MEQRVQVAIRVAQHVVGEQCPKWSAWAEAWLSGRNRTEKTAEAARAAAATAAAWTMSEGILAATATAAMEAAKEATMTTTVAARAAARAAAETMEAAETAKVVVRIRTGRSFPNLAALLQESTKLKNEERNHTCHPVD